MSLLAAGMDYEIAILENGTPESLSTQERWWIAFGRGCGWPLTNLTDGGEGTPGHVKTPEQLERLSAAMSQKTIDNNHKTKLHVGRDLYVSSGRRDDDYRLRSLALIDLGADANSQPPYARNPRALRKRRIQRAVRRVGGG